MNLPCANLSQTGQYSIFLPFWNGRQVDLGNWLQTETLYPPADHLSKCSALPGVELAACLLQVQHFNYYATKLPCCTVICVLLVSLFTRLAWTQLTIFEDSE